MIPSICAMMHGDKHVVKMILETCQLLCSAHHIHKKDYEPPYRLTHKNHPSAIWTRISLSNYKWLCQLGLELCKEYTYRYGKIHKCEQYIKQMSENMPDIVDIGFTPVLQAMPDIYKEEDFISAYRNYYFFEKFHLHSWKKRDIPGWVVENKKLFE